MTALNLFLILWLFLPQPDDQAKVYEVRKIKQEIVLDGKGSDPQWGLAGILTDFHLPWANEIPQPTSFSALYTDSSLYLLYHVIDHEIIAPGPAQDKRGVIPSDRVEIFFKVDHGMNPYYCLELDPRARILDYEAKYYRNTNFNWSWPQDQLTVMASLTKDGYIVEARISLQSLQDLGILNPDNSIDVGLFRGDFYATSPGRSKVKWISWVIPVSDKPDFHIDSAFGKFLLVDPKTQ